VKAVQALRNFDTNTCNTSLDGDAIQISVDEQIKSKINDIYHCRDAPIKCLRD
jgi:hypothetical protein